MQLTPVFNDPEHPVPFLIALANSAKDPMCAGVMVTFRFFQDIDRSKYFGFYTDQAGLVQELESMFDWHTQKHAAP